MATTPASPNAGAPPAPMDDHDALPPGTRFGELEIVRVLGIGGFGIVYLAQDHALERQVALKEYMPGSLAGRGKGQMVSIRSGAHTETYALGLRSFVNEARLLARFNHPSLVKVYRFWEENGTAYMVMPYLQGRTLRDVRRSMSTAPSEAWVRSVIDPMLDALELLHSEDVYHRDIAPDNILLPPGELPVLLDFGAARRAIGDRTQTFTAILKPSYAPIEQYAESVSLRQGPWTDLYALGAVVYYLLRGTPPPPATARAVQDDVVLLPAQENPGMSPGFLAAIEWALAVRPGDRPASIAALRDVLEGRAQVPMRTRATTAPPERTVKLPPREQTDFAPTMPAEHAGPDSGAMEATRPMTVAPSATNVPAGYPPVAQRTTPPAVPVPMPAEAVAVPAPPKRERVRPDATVMPVRATVEAPPARRRGIWALAAVAAMVGVGAMAAWMVGGRTPSTEVAAPSSAASVMAPPASLPDPAAPVATAGAGALPASSSALPAPVKAADPIAALKTSPPASVPDPRTAALKPVPSKDSKAMPATEASSVPVHHREEARPADRRLVPPRDESAHAQAGPDKPVQAVPAAVAPIQGATSPREACGGRVFLALAVCMEEQCERPRFKNHPQCDKVRAIIERRKRNDSGD